MNLLKHPLFLLLIAAHATWTFTPEDHDIIAVGKEDSQLISNSTKKPHASLLPPKKTSPSKSLKKDPRWMRTGKHRFASSAVATAASSTLVPEMLGNKKEQSEWVPELQVGCGHGYTHDHDDWRSRTRSSWSRRVRDWRDRKDRKTTSRRRRDAKNEELNDEEQLDVDEDAEIARETLTRKRRGYYHWAPSNSLQAAASGHRMQASGVPSGAASMSPFGYWQPAVQQPISRPYFIPVWGVVGSNRTPLYFAPQPIGPGHQYESPPFSSLAAPASFGGGFPHDSPRISYLPPKGYLPPRTGGAVKPPVTQKPQWDDDDNMQEEEMGGRPGSGVDVNDPSRLGEQYPVWDTVPDNQTPNQPRPNNMRPGGRPQQRPTFTTTEPPLLHAGSGGSNQGQSPQASNDEQPVANVRPTRPPVTRPTRPTRPPSTTTAAPRPGRGPSRCVWAIISCCTANSGDVNLGCFEELGCPGSFWDTNPCDSPFARAAVQNALNFYNMGGTQ